MKNYYGNKIYSLFPRLVVDNERKTSDQNVITTHVAAVLTRLFILEQNSPNQSYSFAQFSTKSAKWESKQDIEDKKVNLKSMDSVHSTNDSVWLSIGNQLFPS